MEPTFHGHLAAAQRVEAAGTMGSVKMELTIADRIYAVGNDVPDPLSGPAREP
jgi:hypothetical protein